MADTDPNKGFGDARSSLRDTAKWIVSILGATVVLVIGGGLIAKIPDLEMQPRIVSANSARPAARPLRRPPAQVSLA